MRQRFRLYPDAFYVGLLTSASSRASQRECVQPEELTFPTRAEVTPGDDLVMINAQQNMVNVALDLVVGERPPESVPHCGVTVLGGELSFDCGPGGAVRTDIVLEPGQYDVYGEIEHIDDPYVGGLPDQRCTIWLVRSPAADR